MRLARAGVSMRATSRRKGVRCGTVPALLDEIGVVGAVTQELPFVRLEGDAIIVAIDMYDTSTGSQALTDWAGERTCLTYIPLGTPWHYDYIESF